MKTALSPQQKIAYAITAFAIILPLVILYWNIPLGVVMLLVGTNVSFRAIRLSQREDTTLGVSDEETIRIGRAQGERARTIYVQLVDNDGVELPPDVAQECLTRAQAKAGPRDTVIGIHHKIHRR